MTLPFQTPPSAQPFRVDGGTTPDGPLPSGRAGAVGNETKTATGEEERRAALVTPTVPALSFTVRGTPAPQGSKRGYVVNDRAVMVESSKKVKPWREAVKHAALDYLDRNPARLAPCDALMLTVVYTLPRPKSHYRTGRNAHLLREHAPKWPTGKPDRDKLDRSTSDALTDAGIWRDDAQVVVCLSVKTYPDVHPKALPTPGAYIRIIVLPPDSKDV